MSSQNFAKLGANDAVRTRRFKVLQLYLRNATPPEIAYSLGLDVKQVYRDTVFLRGIQLNDLPLEIIRDMGTNFYEMEIRELHAQAATLDLGQKDDRKFYIDLKNAILKNKIESLKLQGAYDDAETKAPGPIQIIFEEVDGTYGINPARRHGGALEAEKAGGEDHE